MPTTPDPTPYNLAAYHAEQLANALELMCQRRTPDHVAQARRVLSGYYGSSINPRAKLSPKERRAAPPLQLSGSDWEEIYYAIESKAIDIEQGRFSPDDGPRGGNVRWGKQLRRIMEKIEGAGINV